MREKERESEWESERKCACVCVCVCVRDLNYRTPDCRFSPRLRSGFTDASRATLARNSPSRHLPSPFPRYPCFALADLIRDSALNLVRYTAVCMPQLALPATSAIYTHKHTQTLTLFSLLLRVPLARITYLSTYLPTLRTHRKIYVKIPYTYIHTYGNPPISRIVSPLVSTLFVLRSLASEDRYTPSPSFSPRFSYPLPSSFYPLPFTLFSISHSLFLSFFLSFVSVSLYFHLSPLPLSSHRLYPWASTPVSSPRFIPLLLSREGTLADAPDVSTVRLLLPSPPPPTQTASPPPMSPSHSSLQRHYLNPTYVFHPLLLPSSGTERAQAKASLSSSSPRSHLN